MDLKDLKTLELKDIWQFCYDSMIKQGNPSVENGNCLYRGPDGRKCAIGFIIQNEDYEKDMNSESASTICFEYYGFNRGNEEVVKKVKFLEDIQHCHDRNWHKKDEFFIKDFKKDMDKLKKEYAI